MLQRKKPKAAAKEKWSDEDDEILKANYPTCGAAIVAKMLNRTIAATSARAKRSGLKVSRETRARLMGLEPWTSEDERILCEFYPGDGPTAVAKILGRSRSSVIARAKTLRIRISDQRQIDMIEERSRNLFGRVMRLESNEKIKANRSRPDADSHRKKTLAGQRRMYGDAFGMLTGAMIQITNININGETMTGELIEVAQSNDAAWLLDELRSSLDWTIKGVRHCASIVVRLDDLGVEIPAEIPFVDELRKIGRGRMLDSLFIKHIGCADLLKRASSLSLEQQKKLAADKPLKVVKRDGIVAEIRPSELSPAQRKQVIGPGEIRSVATQKAMVTGTNRDRVDLLAEARIRLMQLTTALERAGISEALAEPLAAIESKLENPV